jgi:hypothetical protein
VHYLLQQPSQRASERPPSVRRHPQISPPVATVKMLDKGTDAPVEGHVSRAERAHSVARRASQ